METLKTVARSKAHTALDISSIRSVLISRVYIHVLCRLGLIVGQSTCKWSNQIILELYMNRNKPEHLIHDS